MLNGHNLLARFKYYVHFSIKNTYGYLTCGGCTTKVEPPVLFLRRLSRINSLESSLHLDKLKFISFFCSMFHDLKQHTTNFIARDYESLVLWD